MNNNLVMQTFLDAAEAWVCDGYSIDVRFLAILSENGGELWDMSLVLNPLPAKQDLNFYIESETFAIGQIQNSGQDKNTLLNLLVEVSSGILKLPGKLLSLPNDQVFDYFSEMSHRERWFSELHLQVGGGRRPIPSPTELANIDNSLRLARPPFDGMSDAARWLGLRAIGSSATPPTINIRISPPVDLIFDECSLVDDQLYLTMHAHPQFDVARIGLSICAVPGNALDSRRQIADEISWSDVRDGRLEGRAQIQLKQADSVLVMLMIGTSTVRRQWFIDPAKARNNRHLAINHFDKDLKMVRLAVLDSSDSNKFEQGVASLFFLLGFNPVMTLETDAPDLIVTTPGGKLVIVECTTRIADFASKVGKLVDRRGSLSKSLMASGHSSLVSAILVCRLPRDQIAAQADELRTHNIVLIAGEELAARLDRVRVPNDPDRMLDEELVRLSNISNNGLFPS